MDPDALAARVANLRTVDPATFNQRVAEDAEFLKQSIADGRFDNSQAIIGLEYELYGVDPGGQLARLPRRLLDLIGFGREVGRHQAELNTSPQPLSRFGLDAQQAELQARIEAATTETLTEDIRLVSDGMWTIPPAGETAHRYLTDAVEHNGVVLGKNVSPSVRFHAQANLEYGPRLQLSMPNVSCSAQSVALNSVITSIQPHYQVPRAADLPEHFRFALRVAGPLLAIGVNSPFFPPDLYDERDPDVILETGWMENRIGVFEQVMNADGAEKVRFPRDIESTSEAIDRIVEDRTVVPRLFETGNGFDDRLAHFRYKRKSYWRWVRPVLDGASPSDANARIEFRPIPAQPTIRDSIAFLALFAGLMESLPRRAHPVRDLDWETAKANFYAAARHGLDATLEWIDVAGDETTEHEVIYGELFELARDGLERRGLSAAWAERFITPLRVRIDRTLTPAAWKRREFERRVGDDPVEDAVYGMQRAYIRRQADTLIEGDFTEWLRSGRY